MRRASHKQRLEAGRHLRTARSTLLTEPLYASAPSKARPATPATTSCWLRFIFRRGHRLLSDTTSASSMRVAAAPARFGSHTVHALGGVAQQKRSAKRQAQKHLLIVPPYTFEELISRHPTLASLAAT